MIEYSSNNSGGSWWLNDQQWLALEKAGWNVHWYRNDHNTERFLGALASSASREGLSMRMAIAEWEDITGENSADLGCSCCGTPHTFTEYDGEGNMGEMYSPDYPSTGNRYEEL